MRSRTLTPELGATFGVSGFVTRSAGRLEIHGSLVNSLGKPLLDTAVVGDSGDHFALVDSLGGLLVATMGRGLGPLMPGGGIRLSRAAVLEYMKGEEAVEHDAWLAAERHYANALAIDSTFLLAAWRLGNARRWMPLRPTPPFPDNFRDLFAQHGRDLPRTDSLLIAAQFAPSGGARFAAYESALASDTANATAMLLYGDELFHRGPLAGRPLEEAARMLARATAANPRLAPAWEHLTWALIRLGRKEEASRALDSLERTAGRPEESEIFLPEFLRLASTARFSPGKLDPAGWRAARVAQSAFARRARRARLRPPGVRARIRPAAHGARRGHRDRPGERASRAGSRPGSAGPAARGARAARFGRRPVPRARRGPPPGSRVEGAPARAWRTGDHRCRARGRPARARHAQRP